MTSPVDKPRTTERDIAVIARNPKRANAPELRISLPGPQWVSPASSRRSFNPHLRFGADHDGATNHQTHVATPSAHINPRATAIMTAGRHRGGS